MSEQRELELCRYNVLTPYERGAGLEWEFPDLCACCGGAAEAFIVQRVTHDSGNTKWWRDISVPYCGVCAQHVDARNRSTRGAQRAVGSGPRTWGRWRCRP